MRLIGYDTERGKGDHGHVQGREEPYAFTTPEALIEDVQRWLHNFGRRGKWNFCLTAGTLLLANQERQ